MMATQLQPPVNLGESENKASINKLSVNSKADIIHSFSGYLQNQGLSKNSIRNYLADFSKFFDWYVKNNESLFSLEKINLELINYYLEKSKENQVSPATLNRYGVTLKQLFKWVNPNVTLPQKEKPFRKSKPQKNIYIPVIFKTFLSNILLPQLSLITLPKGVLTAILIASVITFSGGIGGYFLYKSSLNNEKNILSSESSNISKEEALGQVLSLETEKAVFEINLETAIKNLATVSGLFRAEGGLTATQADIEGGLTVGSNSFIVNSQGAIEAATGIQSSGNIILTGLTSGSGDYICLDSSN